MLEGEGVIYHCEHEANTFVDKSKPLLQNVWRKKKETRIFFLVYISVGIEKFGESNGGSCCESGG